MTQVYNTVKNIVLAVEQSLGPGKGADKKQEAIAYIKKLLGHNKDLKPKTLHSILKQAGLK